MPGSELSTHRSTLLFYPCRCLWRGFLHRIRTTPRRRTTLHLAHMGFTDDLTFITIRYSRYLLKAIGDSAPGQIVW